MGTRRLVDLGVRVDNKRKTPTEKRFERKRRKIACVEKNRELIQNISPE
jgi:hypothetical protein